MAKDKPKKPTQVVDLDKTEIKTAYCIPDELREEQIRLAVKRIPGRIQKLDTIDEPIAMVCFGPSLRDTWKELRNFKFIMTCSGAHGFLVEKGIKPTWHVEVDPRAHKIQLIGQPQKETEYLIASCGHPKLFDHLEGYNVKLWHSYSNEKMNDLPNCYPPNEWIFTGGSNVGMRSLVLARFLGFINQHVFGMDCSFPEGNKGEHASPHPNPHPGRVVIPYNGRNFNATPTMVEYARNFFHEQGALPDVKFKLYGDGLLQEMFKTNWGEGKTKVREQSIVAFRSQKTISEGYKELNRKLHESNDSYGRSGGKRAETVKSMVEAMKKPVDQGGMGIEHPSVLDYGCGKGELARKLPFPIWEYDPAIPGKDVPPRSANLVVCTDVLEHIEPDMIDSVIADLARCTLSGAYLVIATTAAIKVLEDGRNAHLIQEGEKWWRKKLEKFFVIDSVRLDEFKELHIIVAPKPIGMTALDKFKVYAKDLPVDMAKEKDVITVEFMGKQVGFRVLSDTTKWRAESLLRKEPATIEWIKSFDEGDILLDVGANVGGYSLLAAVGKKCIVYAIEPESQNYAALNANILLNKMDTRVRAYCIALSHSTGYSALFLSQMEIGGSCHAFGSKTNFKGGELESKFAQGCFSTTMNKLVTLGAIKQPHHIKIDVDGFEDRVINGGWDVIKNAKSLLVEINPELATHRDIVKKLQKNGFDFDPKQVEKSTRKEGAFKGVAEHIFRKVKD